MSGTREADDELSELTGPIIRTVDEGVRLAVEYYENNKVSKAILDARKCTASAMLDFHKKADIYDETIEVELKKFQEHDALVIEVAHQPNIFPYSGYYKKLILGKILKDKLEAKLDVPVVLTFGFHDQDFANPKWFRRTELPDLYSQDGVLGLKLPVSRRSKKVMYAVPAPDDKQLSSWKTVLENWLTNNIRRFNKMVKGNHAMVGLEEGFMIDKDRSNMIRGRMRRVYELMEESQKAADTITEFNAFFTAKLACRYWQYPYLFYEYHSVQKCYSDEWKSFIGSGELLNQYAKKFADSYRKVTDHDITFDFNMPSADQAPFWYQCECGGKLEVTFDIPSDSEEPKFNYELCPECGKKVEESLSSPDNVEIGELISPRAVYRPILITNALRPSIFVSGLAAQGFHMISRGIAGELDVKLPPYIIWPGGDEYRSLAKMVAELTRTELESKAGSELTMKDKKVLENYPNTMSIIPSIIDYLINIGLPELAEAWEKHLETNGDLVGTPKLPSVFD